MRPARLAGPPRIEEQAASFAGALGIVLEGLHEVLTVGHGLLLVTVRISWMAAVVAAAPADAARHKTAAAKDTFGFTCFPFPRRLTGSSGPSVWQG